MAVPLGVNRSFFRTPGRAPDTSGSSNQGPASRRPRSELLKSPAARLPTSRPGSDFRSCFKDLKSHQRLRLRPRSERRRLSSGRPPGCQPTFFRSSADPRKVRIFWRAPPADTSRSQASRSPRARWSTTRTRDGFVRIIKSLRPLRSFGRRLVPSGGGYLFGGRPDVNRPAQRISQTGGMPHARRAFAPSMRKDVSRL